MIDFHAVGRAGQLQLTFARRGAHTALIENVSRPPLQVMRAISDTTGCACVYLLSPSGGVLQHDRYTLHLTLQPETHALFTTPSGTRIYRMPHGYAQQTTHLHLQAHSVLEHVPDATILFADADYRQTTEVMLEEGALLILHEIVLPGRLAHGEWMAFRQFQTRLIVQDARGLLLFEQARLTPATTDFAATGLLEGFTCWGNLCIVGDLARWGISAESFCAAQAPHLNTKTLRGGVSPLARNGIAARVLGHSLQDIQRALEQLRLAARAGMGIHGGTLRK